MNQKLNKDREDLEELLVPNPELKQGPNYSRKVGMKNY
jgi:hypothetical protein